MRLASIVVIVIALGSSVARAQEVTEDYIVNQLGPAAAQIEAEGLSGSFESSPRLIEILQAYGIAPAFETTVAEARMLVRQEREDRERIKEAGFDLEDGRGFTPSQRIVRLVGYMRVAMSCGEAQQKAAALDRLSNALWGASLLNVAGAGIAAATGAGAVLAVPLGLAATVTGLASTAAGKLAGAYRGATCTNLNGGDRWKQPRRTMLASLPPERFRMPDSRRGVSGFLQVA